MYDICIVGGGASGLMTAMLCAKQKLKVLVLEKNEKLGKKLLATGNGRCNLSNQAITGGELLPGDYNDSFVETALNGFDCETARKIFFEAGLLTRSEGGLVYPYSFQAVSVKDILEENLKNLAVDVVTDVEVADVEKINDSFLIEKKYVAKNLLLACGSKVGGGHDSSGLAKKLGLASDKQKETLCALKTKTPKNLSGVRVKARAKLLQADKIVFSEDGEVLFRDNGLSGIVIFNSSRYVVEGGSFVLSLDLMPEKTLDEVEGILRKLFAKAFENDDKNLNQYETVANALKGIFHKNLAKEVLERVKKNATKKVLNLETMVYAVKNAVKNFEFAIDGLLIDNAQVARGGVNLSQINPQTLESCIEGCFVSGEFLNIDGKCGGYNLHWAWASAFAVANCVIERTKNSNHCEN